MAAEVEVQTGEVRRTVVGGRLHLSPLTDASNSLIEIPSITQSHIITPEPNKPAPGPKPRLTPKPFAVERNATIKPIVAPKPQPKPRPESTGPAGYKPEPPCSPKPQQPAAAGKPSTVSSNPNRPASTSFKTSNKLASGQTTKPVAQPFKPAPSLDLGDPGRPSPPSPTERQKPAASGLAYSKSLSKLPAAEWSGTTKREDEKGQLASGRSGPSITRAKSMGFLAQVGQEEEEKEKAKPEAAVPLRTRPRSSRPRPVSAIFPDSPTKTETPVPAPRWTARRPLSADLTSKFESIGLSLHRKNEKADTKENTPEEKAPPQKKEPEKPTSQSTEGLGKPAVSDQSNRKTEEVTVKEAEEERRAGSIKSRISLLLDSSSSPASDTQSPGQPAPENEPAVGVKQRIKQLTEDTTPTQSPVVKPPLKPRPLPLDLTKRFSSERSPDLGSVSLSEATDRHDISKDPQRRIEESSFSPSHQKTLVDFKDYQEQIKKASTPEGPEAGQTFGASSKETGDIQTVRASLFENVVERRSVLMVDESKAGNKARHSLSSSSFKRGSSEDEGTLVTATYKEPMSPSSPLRVVHAFDTVQAVEENRAVSENIPSAQWEDKAMTLRARRSEGSRPLPERTAEPASPVTPEQQPRYLRVGALQKWTAAGLEQEAGVDKGTLKEAGRDVALDKDRHREAEQEEMAAAPKRLKMLQGEEQAKPRATYFALTGQMQEPSSPVDGGASMGDFIPGSSQGKILPVRRNTSLDGKSSQDLFEELMKKSHMSHGEIRPEGPTKEEMMEVEKKRVLKKEAERQKAKLKEVEREKQRQLEMEREAQEFERLKEREMQREFERQRQKAFEKEKQEFEEKQRALERQKQIELEKQKLQELEREKLERERQQRQLEKEKRRELERQRRIEKEKQREQERERQREQERQRQREEERQRELDKERQLLEIQKEKQRTAELERLREKKEREQAEKMRQMALEQEMLRIKELEKERERQREMEKEHQKEMERERQREMEKERQKEMERERQREMEKERQKEMERERQKELERQRRLDLEKQELENQRLRQRELEKEKQRKEEIERVKEMERQQLLELQKQKQKEKERQQILELEKQRLREKKEREEAEKVRQMALEQEMLRIKELEKERERQREMERERQKEMERERQKELERQRQRDLERERQRLLDLEKQELENQRLRQRELEKEKQRKEEIERVKEMERRQLVEFEKQKQAERERQQVLEMEKRRLKEKMEKEEAERMRQVAKQQETERQRLKEKQKKEEQERARLEPTPLRPKGVDVDSVLRSDPFPKAAPQRSDLSTRWKEPSPRAEEPYKPHILDLDFITSQAPLSPSKDLFSGPGAQSVDTGILQPERDISWKVPTQTSASFTSPMWTTSPQDPWELRPVEMSVDQPAAEPRKQSVKLSPEQLLLRQEERVVAPQRPRSAGFDETLNFIPFPGTDSGGSAGGEQIWLPREPHPPDSRAEVQSHRRSQGSQELNRLRSRSVSRRSAPSASAVEVSLSRMRSRSAHREQDRHSWVQQKQSPSGDEEGKDSPVRDTDSQYGTWETGLRTDDSLTPATPSSESNLSPSPRKPSPPHTPGDAAPQVDAVDSLLPSSSSDSQLPSFPDAPVVLLDTSALRSRAQLGKKRAPRTRPTRAARLSAALTEEGATEDWLYRDSTQAKPESKDDDSDSEETTRGADGGAAVASQPQRVALFPGMDPSALKAQLKKRGESDNQTDGPSSSPSQLSRSPKSPFLPRAARVLPPPGGKENGEEDSPQWLKELKSKKRLSQYDNDS